MSDTASAAYGIGLVVIEFGCFTLSFSAAVWFAQLFPERYQIVIALPTLIALITATSWFAVEFLL